MDRRHRMRNYSFVCGGLGSLLLLAFGGVAVAQQTVPLSEVDRALDDIQRVIDDAYFQTALGLIASQRDRLDGLPSQPGLSSRRARLEVLTATAEVALGHGEAALESMRRALSADAALDLNSRNTPPKVLALLREARPDLPSEGKR